MKWSKLTVQQYHNCSESQNAESACNKKCRTNFHLKLFWALYLFCPKYIGWAHSVWLHLLLILTQTSSSQIYSALPQLCIILTPTYIDKNRSTDVANSVVPHPILTELRELFHFCAICFVQPIACVGFNECWHWPAEQAHCFKPHIETRAPWFSPWCSHGQLCLLFASAFVDPPHSFCNISLTPYIKVFLWPKAGLLEYERQGWLSDMNPPHTSMLVNLGFVCGHCNAPPDKAKHVATNLLGLSYSLFWWWVIAFLPSCVTW